MKSLKNLFLGSTLTILVGLMPVGQITAQTFKTLVNFNSNPNGGSPDAGLILSSGTLYGTTYFGSSGNGSVFKVKTDGSSFGVLHNFNIGLGSGPAAALVLSGSTLYGTTSKTSSGSGNGLVFSLSTNGGSPTTLHTFTATSGSSSTNSDGAIPVAGLNLSGNTLYGTTTRGGTSGSGVVFTVKTSGANFTNLHSFTSTNNILLTNSDGATPYAGLILSGNILYGTARNGGDFGKGTVYALNTNGTGFITLHSFTATSGPSATNSDGTAPQAALVLSGNILYGAASTGGDFGSGTLFKLNTDGTGFTTLHNFTSTNNVLATNSDGATPYAGLIVSGNTLYGTAYSGGSSGFGTVFAVKTNGTDFTILHNFSAHTNGMNSDGLNPIGGLVLSGNSLYSTASGGGSSGWGTVYSISFTPQLEIVLSETNVILSWPMNVAGFSYAGFTLQSTTNLVATNSWSPVSPAPTVVNGQNTVTNLASSAEKYYRLIQ
ncbi:MAG: choice-of-anchor tandem repeat GloVer-containing protein [Limisphaerales bacterium]